LTASFWNAQVRDNMNDVGPAYARISGGTSQTGIVANTWTKLNSSGATVTNPLGWTISAGAITIPGDSLPGIYAFYGYAQWDDNTTGHRVISIAPTSDVSFTLVTGNTLEASAAYTRSTVSGLALITSSYTACVSLLTTTGPRALAFNNADFVVARVCPYKA
jgi:hypothetical protein